MMTKQQITTQPEGAPEQIAALRRQQEEAEAELERRIAEGRAGDQLDELTPEDEEILREIWAEPYDEPADLDDQDEADEQDRQER